MDRVVDAQWAYAALLVGRVVPATRHYRVDNIDDRLIRAYLAMQAYPDFSYVSVYVLNGVLVELQVARVPGTTKNSSSPSSRKSSTRSLTG